MARTLPVRMARVPEPPQQSMILDQSGRPIEAKPIQRRTAALAGGSNIPYDAADFSNPHFAMWNPFLGSADGEYNPYRDRVVARVRDLVRNDGWASGVVTRILDNTVGATFRPLSKPDYRGLAAMTGIKAFDAKWADEYGRAIDTCWRAWALNPGFWADTQRGMTVNQQFRLAFRHKLVDGDALAQIVYKRDRIGYGKARYGTTLNLIDPDRLSNPGQVFDMKNLRGGVAIDDDGAAMGYHIRRAHQADWFNAPNSLVWDYVPRETKWGRPIMIHDFDRTRAGEHRGAGGIFAPILDRIRMLAKYDRAELDAAIINATFAAFIESPFDAQMVEQALGDEIDLNQYQMGRSEFHQQRKLLVGESKMLNLYPGEKIGTVDAARPSTNFGTFESAFLRNVASATGLTEQQVSQDWRGVNYSSARAALLESWKTLQRRRADFGNGFGLQVRCAVLEEFHAVEELPLPKGAPDFADFRAMYAACRWGGPGRGYPDPVADREGAVLGMTAGLTTLEMEALEGSDMDWEEILDQREIEVRGFTERGLPVPEWSGVMAAAQANKGGSHDPNSPNYRSTPGEQ